MGRNMTPLTGWAVVIVHKRCEWTAFPYVHRTRRECKDAWVNMYKDKEKGLYDFNRRMALGEIRYARIVVREARK